MTGRRMSGAGIVALAAATLALAAIVALTVDVGSTHAAAGPLASAPRISLIASTGEVRVESDRGLPARFVAFSPGRAERWRLTAASSSAADMTLDVDRSGPLVARPDGLALAVASCSGEWSAERRCAGSSATILPVTALDSRRFDTPLPIGRVGGRIQKHLLLTFSLPDTAAAQTDDSLMSLTATVGVTVKATGGLSGGVRPGQGGAGLGGGGTGGGGNGGHGQSGPADGAPGDPGSPEGATAPSGQSAGSRNGAEQGAIGFGRGQLAWTGSSIAVPVAVGTGFVIGGTVLAARRRRARRSVHPASHHPDTFL